MEPFTSGRSRTRSWSWDPYGTVASVGSPHSARIIGGSYPRRPTARCNFGTPPSENRPCRRFATKPPFCGRVSAQTDGPSPRALNPVSCQLLSEPMRQPGSVWSVRWSPDGRILATTSMEGAACLWDARTGHRNAEPFLHQDQARRAEFSPGGRRLLTASLDGTVKVWDLALARPPLPVPDWLPMLAESLGGKRVGPKDSLESVPGNTFQLARTRIGQWSTNDYYGRWGNWLLKERFERPVKAFQP